MKLFRTTLVALLALLLLTGSLAQGTAALADALTQPQTTVLENQYLKITVDNSTGRFGIRTADGQPVRKNDDQVNLMFGGDSPDTSFTSFRIDGTDYIFGNPYKFGARFFSEITPPVIVNSPDGTRQIETVWTIKGVAIKQILMLYPDPQNKLNAGNVNIRYEVRNDSGVQVELGTRILLDTQIGANDGPEFQIGTGYKVPLMVERRLVHDPEQELGVSEEDRLFYKLPPYWVMRDKLDLTNPAATHVVAYGFNNFSEGNINIVDEMIVGHWNGLANTKWDYTPNGNLDFTRDTNDYGTADSAVAFYWQPKALETGRVQTFETVYGLGEIIEPDQVFSIRYLDPPQQLATNADASAYADEGVFTLNIEAENLAQFNMEHTNMTALLELESGLSFVRLDDQGRMVRDGQGLLVTEPYRSKELIFRKSATPEEAANGIEPKYKPGDTETFSFVVQAKGRPWPTVRQYMLTVKSPETVSKLDGIADEGLRAQYESVKSNFILLPAVGQAAQTYVYGLAPKEAYREDVKYITVNLTNVEAYHTGNALTEPNFDLYFREKASGKRYKVPVKDAVILQPADDGFSGDMRIAYRGGERVDQAGNTLERLDSPALPLGEYEVEIDFKGDTGGDPEIAAMYDIVTKQTFRVTDNQEARVREAGLMAVYKQYVDLSGITSDSSGRYLEEINTAFPEKPFLSGAILKDAVDGYKTVKLLVAAASKAADPKFDITSFTEEESLEQVPVYKYRLFDSEAEAKRFFETKNAGGEPLYEKLVEIRGMVKEVGQGDQRQVIVDTKTEPAIINEAVAYKGKDIVFVKGKLDVFGIPQKVTGYEEIPFFDSLFVKGEGTLGVANSGFVFHSGEWTLDFFNGFEKKLAPSLIVKPDDNYEVFPDNHSNPEDTSLNGTLSWAAGALGDRLNPLRQLMLQHVYFNKHSLFAAPGLMIGGFGFSFQDFVLRPGGISFGGKVSMKIIEGEVRNVVFNDEGFVGVEARLRFDLGKDLGLFEPEKKEKKEDESTASGAISIVHYDQKPEGYQINNEYGIRFKADVKGKFEVQAELAFKQVQDGRILPDVVAFGMGVGKPGVLLTGATYLSAVRGAVRELADTIAGGTSSDPFPLVIQAGVDVTFGLAPVYLHGSIDLTVKRTGIALLGKMDYSADPKGTSKIEMITRALLEAQWVTPWFVRVEAELDIGGWGVIIGKAGIFVGQNLEKKRTDFEGYIGARLQIPDGVPVVGGMPLASVFLGLNNDKIWGSVGVLFISLGITYYWGGGVEFGTSQEELPEGFAHLLIQDPEKGPQLLIIGEGMRTVATSWLDAEKQNHEIVYHNVADGVQLLGNGAMDAGIGGIHAKEGGRVHLIPLTGVSGNAIIEVEYDSAQMPAFSLKDSNDAVYPILFDNTNTNPAANAFTQHIPAAQSATKADVRKAYVLIPQAKVAEGGEWTLTAEKPVATRLLSVPAVAALKHVGLTTDSGDPMRLTASWQVENAKPGDTVDLYLTRQPVTAEKTIVNGQEVLDSGDPGVLIAQRVPVDADGGVAGGVTHGKYSVDVSRAQLLGKEEDLRGLLQQGDYYVRAALQSAASFQTATSAETYRMVNPLAPGEVSDVQIEPAGNGYFALSFTPAPKKPELAAAEHSYAISALQEVGGKRSTYANFGEQLFTEEELKPYWNEGSGRYEGILVGGWTAFSNSDEVDTSSLAGNTPTAPTTYVGLQTGSEYRIGVAAVSQPGQMLDANDNYHFAGRIDSGLTLLPVPAEPRLGQTADQFPAYLEVTSNQIKQTIHLTSDQTDIEVEAIYDGETIARTELVNSGQTSAGELVLDRFVTDGTYGIELRARNKRTKDKKVTFLYVHVDTSAPILYLDQPKTGQRTEQGAIMVAGTTSKDAELTVYIDQVVEGKGVRVPVAANGAFAADVPVQVDSAEAIVHFVARDKAGNENRAVVSVTNDSFQVPGALVLKPIGTLVPGQTVTVEPMLLVQQGKTPEGKAVFAEVRMTPEQTQRVSYTLDKGAAVAMEVVQVRDEAAAADRKALRITAGRETTASLIQASYPVAASKDGDEDEVAVLDAMMVAEVKVPQPEQLERYMVTAEAVANERMLTRVRLGDVGERLGYQLVYRVFSSGSGAVVPTFGADTDGWSYLPENGVISVHAGDRLVVAKRISATKKVVGASDIVAAKIWSPAGAIGGGGGGMNPSGQQSAAVNNKPLKTERSAEGLSIRIAVQDIADTQGDIVVRAADDEAKQYMLRFDPELVRNALDKGRTIRVELPMASIVIRPELLNGLERELQLSIGPNGDEAFGALNRLAAELSSELLADGQGLRIETNLPMDTSNGYMEVRLPLPSPLKRGEAGALVLLGAEGDWTSVPWRETENEDGTGYTAEARLIGSGSLALLGTAAEYEDIPDGFWGEAAIRTASGKLLMRGRDEGRFDPEGRITRAEYPTVLLRTAGLMNRSASSTFTDVPFDAWYNRSVSIAYRLGIVNGLEDGGFAPNAELTRAEAMTMLGRTIDAIGLGGALSEAEVEQLLGAYADRELIPEWARLHTALSIKYGLIEGEGERINPLGELTRAQAAAIAIRLERWIAER